MSTSFFTRPLIEELGGTGLVPKYRLRKNLDVETELGTTGKAARYSARKKTCRTPMG
jgi:hypothetical protein